jgi:hypothetical protein
MAIKDGGPAFPVYADAHAAKAEMALDHIASWGMSLRDYFAGQALIAEVITTCSDATPESAEALIQAARANGQTLTQRIAHNAYRMADAMLKAREAHE